MAPHQRNRGHGAFSGQMSTHPVHVKSIQNRDRNAQFITEMFWNLYSNVQLLISSRTVFTFNKMNIFLFMLYTSLTSLVRDEKYNMTG